MFRFLWRLIWGSPKTMLVVTVGDNRSGVVAKEGEVDAMKEKILGAITRGEKVVAVPDGVTITKMIL